MGTKELKEYDFRSRYPESFYVNPCLVGTAAKLGGIIRHPRDNGLSNWKGPYFEKGISFSCQEKDVIVKVKGIIQNETDPMWFWDFIRATSRKKPWRTSRSTL